MSKRKRKQKRKVARQRKNLDIQELRDATFLKILFGFMSLCIGFAFVLLSQPRVWDTRMWSFLIPRILLRILTISDAILVVIMILGARALLRLVKTPNWRLRHLRVHSVLLLSGSIYLLTSVGIPALYAYGYINPLKTWFNQYTALGIAFVTGAIVSGILGNLCYDLIKLAVQRIHQRK